jgi:hypothetical protein
MKAPPVPIGSEAEWTPEPVANRKISYPCEASNPGRRVRSLVSVQTELPRRKWKNDIKMDLRVTERAVW